MNADFHLSHDAAFEVFSIVPVSLQGQTFCNTKFDGGSGLTVSGVEGDASFLTAFTRECAALNMAIFCKGVGR